MPEPPDEARTYLHSFGVDISEVYSVPLSSIPVSGTPTLLLLSGNGIVKRVMESPAPRDHPNMPHSGPNAPPVAV